MNREDLRKVQLVQLQIAEEVKRICDKHNIKYSLAYGTLLGAVRHKGFIPWDDDLDITMERSQYDKFIDVCKTELGDAYFLQNYDSDLYFTWPYSKIMKQGTVYKERATTRSTRYGIFIDIFPVDYAPENHLIQEIQHIKYRCYLRMLQLKTGYQWDGNTNIAVRVVKIVLKCSSRFYREDTLKRRLTALLKKYYRKSNLLYNLNTPYSREKELVSDSIYNEYAELEFEGVKFMTIKKYDYFLRKVYGDYMKLPPENERENRHQIVELDFGK